MSKYHSPKFPSTDIAAFAITKFVFISLGHFRPFRFRLNYLAPECMLPLRYERKGGDINDTMVMQVLFRRGKSYVDM